MQAFTWDQAREHAQALAERIHQPVHVVMIGQDYFVMPAADYEKSQEPLPTIVHTYRPAQQAPTS
ncbi:MAG TPA: hypothetical protein VFB38_09600 [Chthonomonadaceae bacterium]|nr:hypothetical protein [Chthonomonadaceae bacterium]